MAARSGVANIFDGRITIFRRVEEGSVEIEACLSPETLSALAEDAEFMQYVQGRPWGGAGGAAAQGPFPARAPDFFFFIYIFIYVL